VQLRPLLLGTVASRDAEHLIGHLVIMLEAVCAIKPALKYFSMQAPRRFLRPLVFSMQPFTCHSASPMRLHINAFEHMGRLFRMLPGMLTCILNAAARLFSKRRAALRRSRARCAIF
jgi:hypothetical protein